MDNNKLKFGDIISYILIFALICGVIAGALTLSSGFDQIIGDLYADSDDSPAVPFSYWKDGKLTLDEGAFKVGTYTNESEGYCAFTIWTNQLDPSLLGDQGDSLFTFTLKLKDDYTDHGFYMYTEDGKPYFLTSEGERGNFDSRYMNAFGNELLEHNLYIDQDAGNTYEVLVLLYDTTDPDTCKSLTEDFLECIEYAYIEVENAFMD